MIGILPAAGHATRFNGFPKFLLPVPEGNLLTLHCNWMLDAGASRVLIGAGTHNAGVIDVFRPGGTRLYMGGATTSETTLLAREECGNEQVLFGMPDIYWQAPGVYAGMTEMLSRYDAVAAVWKVRDDQRGSVGQCELADDGTIMRVVDKTRNCPFEWAWAAQAWNPIFWNYIKPEMPHTGYAMQSAIDAGLRIGAYIVEGTHDNIGSFDQYARLCSSFVQEAVR